jgi:hypothetical protein
MSELLPVKADGKTFYIEVDSAPEEAQSGMAEGVLDRAEGAFESAKATVTTVATHMVGAIRALDRVTTPDEFNLEFAIKFTAEGNAILAKAGLEANLKVTLRYDHARQP